MFLPAATGMCCCCFLETRILQPCWKRAGEICYFQRQAAQSEWAKRSYLFGDNCRLLLTCLSQKDVCSLWLQRIRQQTSVRSNLCFIMSSSTNSTVLPAHKLFSVYYCSFSQKSRFATTSKSKKKLDNFKQTCFDQIWTVGSRCFSR